MAARADKKAATAVAEARTQAARAITAIAGQAMRRAGVGGGLAGVHVKSLSSSYDASRRRRTDAGPAPLRGSGDEHLDPSTHARLRVEAQHLIRNNNLARAIIGALVDAVIPPGGMTFQAATDDPEWNDACERYIENWMDEADARGMLHGGELQALVFESTLVDGDCLIVKLRDGRLQVVESDRIGGQISPIVSANENVVGGVELDALGMPIAYRVTKPGKLATSSTTLAMQGQGYDRVAREDAELAVCIAHRRATLTRGEPLLAASVQRVRDIEQYLVSTAVAAQMAAFLSLIIRTENPSAMQAAMQGETVEAESGIAGAVQKEEIWAPGSVIHLKPGESVDQTKPEQPTQSTEQWVRLQLRIIGADVRLPIEFLLLDFSQANFSSTRAAMALAWKTITRHATYQAKLWTRLARWRIAKAIEDGELPDHPQRDRVTWITPVQPMVDPKGELEATLLAVNGGLMSRKEGIERMGGDYMATMRQIESERALEDAIGLRFPTYTSLQADQNGGSAANTPSTPNGGKTNG